MTLDKYRSTVKVNTDKRHLLCIYDNKALIGIVAFLQHPLNFTIVCLTQYHQIADRKKSESWLVAPRHFRFPATKLNTTSLKLARYSSSGFTRSPPVCGLRIHPSIITAHTFSSEFQHMIRMLFCSESWASFRLVLAHAQQKYRLPHDHMKLYLLH